MWWEWQRILSHGTNFSAGVAILSSGLGVTVVSTTEIVNCQVLLVKADVRYFFMFMLLLRLMRLTRVCCERGSIYSVMVLISVLGWQFCFLQALG